MPDWVPAVPTLAELISQGSRAPEAGRIKTMFESALPSDHALRQRGVRSESRLNAPLTDFFTPTTMGDFVTRSVIVADDSGAAYQVLEVQVDMGGGLFATISEPDAGDVSAAAAVSAKAAAAAAQPETSPYTGLTNTSGAPAVPVWSPIVPDVALVLPADGFVLPDGSLVYYDGAAFVPVLV